ncbi:MAG: hypothetical protein GF401_05920, partial [Chitinivibrionales bacterium]|nr:hypothetical protein [Chitinivibrionales bacterium]
MAKRNTLLLLFFLFTGSKSVIASSEVVGCRVFSHENTAYFVTSERIIEYSSDARNARQLVPDIMHPGDSIEDIVLFEDYLFIVTESGIHSFSSAAKSFEKIEFVGSKPSKGRLAVDYDYLWLSAGRKLWRYDRLGREWFSFVIPDTLDTIIGAHSDEDYVYLASTEGIGRFSIIDEKWRFFPLPAKVSGQSTWRVSGGTLFLIDAHTIRLFSPAQESWETVLTSLPINDLFIADDFLYLSTKKNVYRYDITTSVLRPADAEIFSGINAFTVCNDTLLIPQQNSLVKYDFASRRTSFLSLPRDFPATNEIIRMAPIGNQVVFV